MTRRTLHTRNVSLLAIGASLMLQSGGVSAADAGAAPAADTETIVVTASKRAGETLASAPMALQVLTGEQLKEQHIADIQDLITTAIPGAAEEEQIGTFIRDYSLRGSGAGGGVGDPLIAYYIDDTPYAIPNIQIAPPVRIVDMDHVEVLRGPYGTLYGQGAMGGTIIFHTKEPDLNRFQAQADFTLSGTNGANRPNYSPEAAVSIPLIANELALRVSGGYDYKAGYADVYSGAPVGTPRVKGANDVEQPDLRAVLLWKPTEQLTARLQYWNFGGHQDYSTQMTSVKPAYLADWGDLQGYEKARNNLYSGTLQYDFGFATLTSATSYVNTAIVDVYGLTLAGLGSGSLNQGYSSHGGGQPPTHSFNEEVRLSSNGEGPLHWLGGAAYTDAQSTYWYTLDFPNPVANGGADTTTYTKNWSVFGEVSYDLFDGKLVPLFGLRHYSDDRSFVSISHSNLVADQTTTGSASPSQDTWRANLSYHPTKDLTVFFNAGTGFRAGIMQSLPQVVALSNDGIRASQALTPDTVTNYEVGVRGDLFERALQYSVSGYDLTYKNFQAGVTTSTGLSAFANLGEAKTDGIDLELHWKPLVGLTLGFVGNLNYSRYGQVNPTIAGEVSDFVHDGSRLLNTPNYSARFDVNYVRELDDRMNLITRASATPMASRLNQYGQDSAAFTLFSAGLGIQTAGYEIELFGDNLTDRRGPTYIRTSNLLAGPVPRTIGIRLSTQID